MNDINAEDAAVLAAFDKDSKFVVVAGEGGARAWKFAGDFLTGARSYARRFETAAIYKRNKGTWVPVKP